MSEINQTIQAFKYTRQLPFLSEKFISVAMEIPVSHKIQGSADFLRKHILKKITYRLMFLKIRLYIAKRLFNTAL